jgi:hypothetical protein
MYLPNEKAKPIFTAPDRSAQPLRTARFAKDKAKPIPATRLKTQDQTQHSIPRLSGSPLVLAALRAFLPSLPPITK